MNVQISKAALRNYLLANDEKYRELATKHERYEARLRELLSLPYPNEEELIEEVILKKKKLLLKEQMEAIAARLENAPAETDLMYRESSGRSEIHSLPIVSSAETEPISEEPLGDLDVRLAPPPVLMQKIKVKLDFIGNEAPRISYDPDND